MGADVSRARFDPLRDFAGLVLQQGRLLLDGDFNEYVAVLDRRLRAETSDLTSFGPEPGRNGVAWVPRQTPNGFEIRVAGGVITIGRGRMYVDGLLAENHGGPPWAFDALLAERTGTVDTAYDDQPYWPTPSPVPADGPYLAYLDVWEREVTYVEDPSLVEVAVGVDTSARLQTVWQVRLLPNIGTATCQSRDDDIPGWLDVARPSDARLTTGTVAVGPDVDPCELPPTDGYRGLENQTYRVEVHTAGTAGKATFKWSRDNGSVALPVVEMVSATVLRLASVGKDDVLRVSTGDWVEILDDRYELGQRPGEMRKVTVDDAARTVNFAGPLPGDLQPATAADAAARHLRVRRWDQSGVVRSGGGAVLANLDDAGSGGVITVPSGAATKVVLEHGVTVSFPVRGGGRFRAGDHWIFAARTADTSVEILEAAPPLGISHHYARLAVVTPSAAPLDCRSLWPALPADGGGEGGESCDCTVCVTPRSHSSGARTIQDAVDHLKVSGGTVCLAAGVYDVGAGVTVDGARSLRIRGQGPATVLVARGTALTVTRSREVTVEHLAVLSGGAAAAGVRVRSVVATTLQELAVLSYGREGGGAAVDLSGANILLALRGNVLVGQTGISVSGAHDDDRAGGLLAAGLRVEDNVVLGSRRGIDLGGTSAYLYSCRVADNEVVAGRAGGIVATGAVTPGGSLDVVGNKVITPGHGITVGSDVLVDSNTVTTIAGRQDEEERFPGLDGVVVTSGPLAARPGHVRITGNRIADRRGTGIALRAPVRTFMVKQNVLDTVGMGIAVEGKGGAERVAVENNQIFDVAVERREDVNAVAGILLLQCGSVAVVGNTVARVAPDMVAGMVRGGIVVLACASVRVSGNTVEDIGPRGDYVNIAAGIMVVGPFDTLDLSGNGVGFGPREAPPRQGSWHALLVESSAMQSVHAGVLGSVVPLSEGGDALVLGRSWASAAPRRPDHVTVASNFLTGGGTDPTCVVRVEGDAVVDGNQCTHLPSHNEHQLGIVIRAGSVTASSNRVRGDRAMLVLEVDRDRYAAVGNLTAGGVHLAVPGDGVPGPWDALNPMVP